MTTKTPGTTSGIFHFQIQGKRDSYQVTFTISGSKVDSSCSCKYKSSQKLCWHRNYILAGRNNRISIEEHLKQSELVRVLSQTLEGREMLAYAKSSNTEKEACRRCSKENVVDLKKSAFGKLLRIFTPGGRRYLCLSCRWSW